MSCVEHTCTNTACDWFTMDNQPAAAWFSCPRCSGRVSHVSDEADDARREVAEDERERLLDAWER